jgi:hypothetical protein
MTTASAHRGSTPESRAAIPTSPVPVKGRVLHAVRRLVAAVTGKPFYVIYDAVNAANLPAGGDGYVRYWDGSWPNNEAVTARFPDAMFLDITVLWGNQEEIDCEVGNPSWQDWDGMAQWMRMRTAAGFMPKVYLGATIAADFIVAMAERGFPRTAYRLDTAHWSGTRHICGPGVDGFAQADMTQWNGSIGGFNGYDVCEALPSFFDGLDQSTSLPSGNTSTSPVPPTTSAHPVPPVQEDLDMLVVIVTVTNPSDPKKPDLRPVFVLEANTKRWMPNEEFVAAYLAVTGQASPKDLGPTGWAYVVGPRPDAPNSTPFKV